jgi:hypothetical protein
MPASELKRRLGDVCGRKTGGLQNRLRGAVRRPGWVRFPSIPPHSAVSGPKALAQMCLLEGGLDRLGIRLARIGGAADDVYVGALCLKHF